MRLTLVSSPLLGPAVWAPTAEALRRLGADVLVPRPYPLVRTPADVLGHLLSEIPVDVPTVLVPHSNAGVYVAAVAAARAVAGVVFVDAGVPAGAPTTPIAPGRFRDFLASLVEPDGLLPVWTRWWPETDLVGLFPDGSARAAVEAEEVRLPPAYFDAEVPSPPGWRDLPSAYLAFGDTYAAELAQAHRRGWPMQRLEGGHLHPLADPDGVAGAILGLVGQLGLGRG